MAPSFKWWAAKESHRGGTPVVVKMENPKNWSMVELESPSEDDFLIATDSPGRLGRDNNKGTRNRNAKQLTWVLLLKAHRAAGCLTYLGTALIALGSAIKRRVAAGRTDTDADDAEEDDRVTAAAGKSREQENPTVKSRFYSCIKLFLFISLLLLGFEIAAYFKGWHFGASSLQLQYIFASPLVVKDFFYSLYSKWVLFRIEYLAPPLQFLANACTVLFLIRSLNRLVLCLGCFWIRFKRIKPVPK